MAGFGIGIIFREAAWRRLLSLVPWLLGGPASLAVGDHLAQPSLLAFPQPALLCQGQVGLLPAKGLACHGYPNPLLGVGLVFEGWAG